MDITNVWENRDEELVQDCLEEAYTNKGYTVTNNHKSDRRHEDGVDLICKNPDEEIAIQVKIKPLGADIEQLKKLSSSNSNKKIYVYIDDPVVAFTKAQKENRTVEFWDISKLHEFLVGNNSNRYLRILFLSFPVIRRISDILYTMILYRTVEPGLLETSKGNQVRYWWIFKDRTVKLHGSFELIKNWYQKELLEKDIIDIADIKLYLEKISKIFNDVDMNSAMDLKDIINKIGERHPQLISEYVKVTIKDGRSNWLGMCGLDQLKDSDVKEYIKRWIIPEPESSNSFYTQINSYLDVLEERSRAIEDGVDWVFEDSFSLNLDNRS